jgi:hypothetical protein
MYGLKKINIGILLIFLAIAGCNKKEGLFTSLEAEQTHIDFNNRIEENEQFNMLNFMNIYTGAGVGAGDVNNDGLPDLFFSGNIVSNKLYLNQGNFVFKDITKSAGLESDKWSSGVSFVDINQDGWQDIYVCVSGSAPLNERANLLYINQKDNTFKEMASEYGLADTSQSTHAAFFDYDLDGDLDMFLIVNPVDYDMVNVNHVKERKLNGESPSTDKLFRNNGNGTFIDVSHESGILVEGYSLGLGVSDINNDGWPDVYVSNDFMTNDIMYINNQDGTFTDKSHQWLQHTSFAGMGNDLADINNDGLTDIFVLDMLPEDNHRQKTIIPTSSFDKFKMMLDQGYQGQYTRNTLQLNNGQDSFSEIAYLAGISSTDWSWSALWSDYDNDGSKDLFVTNGFARDIGDLDYINYSEESYNPFGNEESRRNNELQAIKNTPQAAITNYFFKNKGNLTFENVSEKWGVTTSSLSNGAVYADMDNDGDLDVVVNNINGAATILKNNSESQIRHHFLKLKLQGRLGNKDAIGAKVMLSSKGEQQYYQHFLSRGYESSVDPTIHFGLGPNTSVDSILIVWPNQEREKFTIQQIDTILYLKQGTGAAVGSKTKNQRKNHLITEVTDSIHLNYTQKENDFVDFKYQVILPHMHSKQGPKLAVGDINGDGLEDFFTGGSQGFSGTFFLQQNDGNFVQKELGLDQDKEDTGALFFDVDGDGDLDLYVVSGSTEAQKNVAQYQDRLYLNDGQANFEIDEDALPMITSSGAVVTEADYDNDGDWDLFVGGRVRPGEYPLTPESYILNNENGKFKDVTAQVTEGLKNVGMVTAALWTDYNQDGTVDLMVTGEFMPLRIFQNISGILKEVTSDTGLEKTHGWWNSLSEGDFDNDGDIDFLAGNLGLNSKFKATPTEPLCIYASDYDKNGTMDPVMCYYLNGENYIFHTRDAFISQMSGMRNRFVTYKDYASITFDQAFTKQELEAAEVFKSETFESVYIENLGNDKFKVHPLPVRAQFAPINAIKVIDVDGDNDLDALMVGNNHSGDVAVGNHDAMVGLVLLNNGKGNFEVLPGTDAGFFVDTDAKDIALIKNSQKENLILVGSNQDAFKVFKIESFD